MRANDFSGRFSVTAFDAFDNQVVLAYRLIQIRAACQLVVG